MDMLCLSSHERHGQGEASHIFISVYVQQGQSTKRPHIIAIFIYPVTIVICAVVIHGYIFG